MSVKEGRKMNDASYFKSASGGGVEIGASGSSADGLGAGAGAIGPGIAQSDTQDGLCSGSIRRRSTSNSSVIRRNQSKVCIHRCTIVCSLIFVLHSTHQIEHHLFRHRHRRKTC